MKRNALALVVLFTMTACQTSGSSTSGRSADPSGGEANTQSGWQKVKEGTSQAATGVKDNLKSEACPVVGNKNTRLYYTAEHNQYATMLEGEKIFGRDDRECFAKVENAAENGYERAPR